MRRVALMGVAALSMLALAATVAQAKPVKVTGGQATFTPSSQLTRALANHGVTAQAIPPATLASDGVLSMPVVGGHISRPHHRGVLRLGGGVKLTKGTHSLALRRLAAVHVRRGSFLTARVRGKRHLIARFIHVTKSVSDHTATLNADVVLSAQAAHLINARAGHHVVSRGAPLGTASATVNLG
jgi:hypothetical protein